MGRHAPLPPFRAQLALLVSEPPEGDAWLHEVKYDGYRIGCAIEGGRATLVSRNGKDWTAQFPEVAAAARALPVRAALLDGEVAALLPDGRTSFQALQNAFSTGARPALAYFVFDLLHLDGEDLAGRPLRDRKAALEELLGRRARPRAVRAARRRAVARRCSARRAGSGSRASSRSARTSRTGPGGTPPG